MSCRFFQWEISAPAGGCLRWLRGAIGARPTRHRDAPQPTQAGGTGEGAEVNSLGRAHQAHGVTVGAIVVVVVGSAGGSEGHVARVAHV